MKCILSALLLLLFFGGSPLAGTSSSDQAPPVAPGRVKAPGHVTAAPSATVSKDRVTRATVLLIETATTILDEALSDLGVSYDHYSGSDFSALDLSTYEHVFVGMDEGSIEAPSIANVAGFAGSGGHLHFWGGTDYAPFAEAVDGNLVTLDLANTWWTTVSGVPHTTVTNTLNYLATDLPASHNFADLSATSYQTRVTGTAINAAALNGDGYRQLFSRTLSAGGTFDWCINSPLDSYWGDGGDYGWLRQVVRNMLFMPPAPPAGVAIYPTRDVTLYGEVPGAQANGAGQHFFTGSNGADAPYRGLLHFDVAAALPPNAIVTSVALRCFMSRTNINAGVQDTQLYAVTQNWGEAGSDADGEEGFGTTPETGDATWAHTFYADSFWTAPGGDFNPALHGSADVDWMDYYFWSHPLMAADVQSWLNNPAANYGWLLKGTEGVFTTSKRFDTKENGNPDFRPVLYVDYVTLPTDVALAPDKDVTLYGESPGDLANGAGRRFFTGKNDEGAQYRGLLHYDIAGMVPPGAVITHAVLVCYVSLTNPNAGPRLTTLHRAEADWGEGASDASGEEDGGAPPAPGDATWLHTFHPGSFWTNPGGDFNASVRAGQIVDGIGYYAWTGSDLKADVQSWLVNPSRNFGWLMMGDEAADSTAKRFNTKEDPDPATWPILYLDYSLPEEFTLNPVKDVTLYGENPGDLANGAGQYFFTGENAAGAPMRGVLQFDLSGIPADTPILSATLTCYMSDTNVDAGPRWTTLHRVSQVWGEGASDADGEEGAGAAPLPGDATWLHTFYPDFFWTNPGGDFSPIASASQLVDSAGYYSWSDEQLTLDVREWIESPGANHGWLMMGDETTYPTSKRFNTREHPDPATRPVLTLSYPVAVDEGQPASAKLSLAAYPNPFNPKTTVSFSLAKSQRVRLDVFDINGRAVRNLWDGPAEAGRRELVWDGVDGQGASQASGIYLIRLRAGDQRETLKAILLK